MPNWNRAFCIEEARRALRENDPTILMCAFIFAETYEGYEYWNAIAKQHAPFDEKAKKKIKAYINSYVEAQRVSRAEQ